MRPSSSPASSAQRRCRGSAGGIPRAGARRRPDRGAAARPPRRRPRAPPRAARSRAVARPPRSASRATQRAAQREMQPARTAHSKRSRSLSRKLFVTGDTSVPPSSAKLFEQLALPRAELGRHLDEDVHELVAARGRAQRGQALAAQADHLARSACPPGSAASPCPRGSAPRSPRRARPARTGSAPRSGGPARRARTSGCGFSEITT